MQHRNLTFADIAHKNIIYYDKGKEDACKKICKMLKIDNLPDYDSEHYYELVDGKFVKKEIDKVNRLYVEERIFKSELLEKFRNNQYNVLFVFQGDVLKGVAHFSDYNQAKVLQAVQDDVFDFEQRLRQFLFLNGFRNQDILDYFEDRAKQNESSQRFYSGRLRTIENRKDEMDQLGEFQMFSLKDLLEFANDPQSKRVFPTEVIEVNGEKIQEGKLVNELRNMAMHGKNPVELDEVTSVYSLDSLKYLFESLRTLRRLTYRIEKLITDNEDYRKSLQLDNQSKLEIIYEKHPKALYYYFRL